jgi:multiple sugar transport system substrate-binding protein
MGRRRFVGLLAAGAGAALGAAGTAACGAVGSSGGRRTALRAVVADYPAEFTTTAAYWKALVHDFEKANPDITVDVDVVDWDHVDARVDAMVKAGRAPDLAQIGSYAGYAAQGLLQPADKLFKVSQQADFLTAMARAGSVDYVQYGLPWVSSARLLFYNKALFDAAGVDRAPRTWAELAHDAELLRRHGVRTPYGLPLGSEEAQAESLMWMLEGAGGYTDNGGHYAIDSDANVKAFTWLKAHLVAKGLTGPGNPAATNRRDTFAAFLAGDVGMLNGHPTLLAKAEAAGIEVGVAELPGESAPATDTLGVADWMMAFRNDGSRLDAQAAFLQHVYDTENSRKFVEQFGMLPVTASVLDAMRADPKQAGMRRFLDELPSAVFYPYDKTSWGAVTDEIKKSIGKAVHGDPAAVLGGIQRFADAQDGK